MKRLYRSTDEQKIAGVCGGLGEYFELDPVFLPVDMAIPCGLILNELATNSLKHAFIGRERGTIEIQLTSLPNESVRLLFRDDGWGLPDGLNLQAAESLGLRLIRMLGKQLRGEVVTRSGEGTTFELRFKITETRVGPSHEAKAVFNA